MNLKAYSKALERRFSKVRSKLKQTAPLIQQINRNILSSGQIEEIVRSRFVKQQTQGKPWKPLSYSTIRERAVLGFGPTPVLVRSGKLFKAATTGRPYQRNNQFILPFRDSSAPKYKGRRRNKVPISSYAFSKKVYPGRQFYAAPNATEAFKVRRYIGNQYVSIATSLFNNKTPSVSNF